MSGIVHQRGDDGQYPPRHPDTVVVDTLTAFLNRNDEPSGADTVALLTDLIAHTGRPLHAQPSVDIDADVEQDRYGLFTTVVTAGEITVRVYQPTDGTSDLHVAITTDDGDDYGLAVTVDGQSVLDAMPNTWTSSVPANLQLNTRPPRR